MATRRCLLLPAALAALLVASGCGGTNDIVDPFPEVDPPGTLVRSALARDTAPVVSEADMAALAAGNRAFACELYQQLASADGNLVFSPLSISTALAMAYAGAEGDTATQLAQALHFTLPAERLHAAFNKLDLSLEPSGQDADKQLALNIVNALWTQQGWTYLDSFLDTLAVDYDAGMHEMDFENDREAARQAINQWVSDATQGRIPELIPNGALDDAVRMVLTNAIYFRAYWASQFSESATVDQPFHRLDGSSVTAKMMHQVHSFGYARADEYRAVSLPYFADKQSMVVVLPDEGAFPAVSDSVDGDWVAALLAGLEATQVDLGFPRFEFSGSADLAEILQALGATDAFSADLADFSGITGQRDLYIQQVRHKAFISVNEKWTEAAGATDVEFGETSVPIAEPVTVDRPFLFFIVDNGTGAVLFVGRVLDPTA